MKSEGCATWPSERTQRTSASNPEIFDEGRSTIG